MKTKIPVLMDLDPLHAACVSYRGDFMQTPEVFAELFERLFAWAQKSDAMQPGSIVFSAYYDNPEVTAPEDMRLDVCLGVGERIETGDGVVRKRFPGGSYAVMRVEMNDSKKYGAAWETLVTWLQENDLEIDGSRPHYEVYLKDPETDPKGVHIVDMCMAVKN